MSVGTVKCRSFHFDPDFSSWLNVFFLSKTTGVVIINIHYLCVCLYVCLYRAILIEECEALKRLVKHFKVRRTGWKPHHLPNDSLIFFVFQLPGQH